MDIRPDRLLVPGQCTWTREFIRCTRFKYASSSCMVSTTGHSSLGLHTAFHVLTRSSGQTVRLTLSPLTRIFRRMRRDKAAPFILGFRLAVWFNLPIPNPSWWIQNRIHVDYVYAGCISPSLLQTMVTHIPIAKLPPRHHTIDQLSSSPNWSLPRGATERQTC